MKKQGIFFKKGLIFATLAMAHFQQVGISVVQDYVSRPVQLANMCLYDWIRLCEKVKYGDMSKIDRDVKNTWETESIESDELNLDSKLSLSGGQAVKINSNKNSVLKPEEDYESSSSDDELDMLNNDIHDIDEPLFFLSNHPQADTHVVNVRDEKKSVIPNFIGALPRRDQSDRNYYCCTMLSLFCPWRSGLDLKTKDQSWDDAFRDFSFTDRQLELMKFFSIPYDCRDARDDYSA